MNKPAKDVITSIWVGERIIRAYAGMRHILTVPRESPTGREWLEKYPCSNDQHGNPSPQPMINGIPKVIVDERVPDDTVLLIPFTPESRYQALGARCLFPLLPQEYINSVTGLTLEATEASTMPSPEQNNLEYSRERAEATLAHMLEVRKQRDYQYHNTRVSQHQALGEILTTLIEAHYRIKLPYKIPGSLAVQFILAMKMTRAVQEPVGDPLPDTYEDAANYCFIAFENAIFEGCDEDLYPEAEQGGD